jgi:cystathionine beta-lyase/cystathionine gamma-synthase
MQAAQLKNIKHIFLEQKKNIIYKMKNIKHILSLEHSIWNIVTNNIHGPCTPPPTKKL